MAKPKSIAEIRQNRSRSAKGRLGTFVLKAFLWSVLIFIVAGTLAGLCGSLFAGGIIAAAPTLWSTPFGDAPWPGSVTAPAAGAAVALAGAVGGFVDSCLGATLEDRWAWMDNDAVNLFATLAGAGAAILATRACMAAAGGP